MPCASGRFEFPATSLIEELNSIDKSAAPGKRPSRKGGVRLLAALGNRHNMRGAPPAPFRTRDRAARGCPSAGPGCATGVLRRSPPRARRTNLVAAQDTLRDDERGAADLAGVRLDEEQVEPRLSQLPRL